MVLSCRPIKIALAGGSETDDAGSAEGLPAKGAGSRRGAARDRVAAGADAARWRRLLPVGFDGSLPVPVGVTPKPLVGVPNRGGGAETG